MIDEAEIRVLCEEVTLKADAGSATFRGVKVDEHDTRCFSNWSMCLPPEYFDFFVPGKIYTMRVPREFEEAVS